MKGKKNVTNKIKMHKLLTHSFIQNLIYGRIVVMLLFLLLQIFLFLIFFLWLSKYVEVFLAFGLICSLSFFIYLINTKGNNEAKIAWIIPVIIFPLFGIGLYAMINLQSISNQIIRKVRKYDLNKNQKIINPKYYETNQPYTQIDDIVTYLKDSAFFPPYTKNDVQYYSCGEDAFPEIVKSLKEAKKFIFLEYFTIFPGVMWDTILDILLQKAKVGVEVRIMLDGVGCVPISPESYVKYLKSLNINACVFIPIVPLLAAYLNNRDHRKICVIDGKVCFTGGINLTDQYINKTSKFGYWKDTVVKVSGSSVRSFTDMFLKLWDIVNNVEDNFDKYLNIKYKVYEQKGLVIPYSDNGFNKKDIAKNVYMYIINTAKKYIHITTPYVILNNEIMNALFFATQRGVEISILVPRTIDHYITFCTGRTFIKNLVDNDIKVYEFTPGFIHAKMFIADDTTAIVGSINLDYRSLFNQFEDAVFIYKHKVIKEIENDFIETKMKSTEFTSKTYKKTPFIRRVIGRVFRLFSPML